MHKTDPIGEQRSKLSWPLSPTSSRPTPEPAIQRHVRNWMVGSCPAMTNEPELRGCSGQLDVAAESAVRDPPPTSSEQLHSTPIPSWEHVRIPLPCGPLPADTALPWSVEDLEQFVEVVVVGLLPMRKISPIN